MNIGVLLAGSGVFDGSEIYESVFTLLAIRERGEEPVLFAPNKPQHHVLNHLTGEEMKEERNVLVESARIARGDITDLADIRADQLDALVIPGGFGAAKNLGLWAVEGPDGEVDPAVKDLIIAMRKADKPICGLCMGPTVIAKALESTEYHPELTVGTTKETSPYDIAGINAGLQQVGSKPVEKTVAEVAVDKTNKIVTAPCFMMEARIDQIRDNAKMAVDATLGLLELETA